MHQPSGEFEISHLANFAAGRVGNAHLGYYRPVDTLVSLWYTENMVKDWQVLSSDQLFGGMK
jgi:hypothetical protein